MADLINFGDDVAVKIEKPKTKSHNPFSEDQISDFKEAFGLFDRDGDGCLQAAELGMAIRSVGGVITDEEINGMVKDINDTKNGRVDFADFLAFMATALREDEGPDELFQAFQAFDKEGTGFIRTSDLQHLLTRLGEKLSDEDVAEVIRDADAEGTGQVNYTEFVKVITS